MAISSHPILSCSEARGHEQELFWGKPEAEWAAMKAAGRAMGDAVWADFEELGPWPKAGRVLVLAGKGHNAGDGLWVADRLLELAPGLEVDVAFLLGERALRPMPQQIWRELQSRWGERVRGVRTWAPRYTVMVDAVFGFQYRAPLEPAVASLLQRANQWPVQMRAAVDLPSGLGEAAGFRADFTYSTGIVKKEALAEAVLEQVGRIRYLDIGMLAADLPGAERVLREETLASVGALRFVASDKRSTGRVGVLGGSGRYPGAVMMTVRAALRAGAGLVTALVPERLVPAFAAAVPEAIWVGWPETPEGDLALEGLSLWREATEKVDAWVVGPGVGSGAETRALLTEVRRLATRPLILDADALHPDIVEASAGPAILTPHAGEAKRLLRGGPAGAYARRTGVIWVEKGPRTRLTAGDVQYFSLAGGPVLARGGSGDLLAGIIGGRAAQTRDLLTAAAEGVLWHGRAADLLARAQGQVAVTTTELLDFLPRVLREEMR